MLHTRSELIEWIKQNVNDRVLLNVIDRGSVEVLGGFNPLPTSTNPGWMVRIKSPFGQAYLIAVAWDTVNFRLYWFRAPNIPWGQWAGHLSNNPLYTGDKPELYAEMKVAWEGHDPRFTRIARCTGVYPEEDGGDSNAVPGKPLADGSVPPPLPWP